MLKWNGASRQRDLMSLPFGGKKKKKIESYLCRARLVSSTYLPSKEQFLSGWVGGGYHSIYLTVLWALHVLKNQNRQSTLGKVFRGWYCRKTGIYPSNNLYFDEYILRPEGKGRWELKGKDSTLPPEIRTAWRRVTQNVLLKSLLRVYQVW